MMKVNAGILAGLGLIAASMAPALANPPAASTAPSGTNAAMQAGNSTADSSGSANSASRNAANQNDNAQAGMTAQNDSGNLPKQTVMALQQALKNAGQSVKPDGVWGPSTEAALKQYQQSSGLPATGQLDDATRAKLNLQS